MDKFKMRMNVMLSELNVQDKCSQSYIQNMQCFYNITLKKGNSNQRFSLQHLHHLPKPAIVT